MRNLLAAFILVAVAACSPQAQKSSEEEATTPAPAGDVVAAPAVDPKAIEAAKRMTDYLRTLTTFEVRARTNRDEVLIDSEQKVQFAGDGLYRIRRPNAFYLESNTDRRQRRFYYDGTTFTIYSPRLKVYAQQPAPPTIREMVDEMENRYGMEVPLADLFYWGTEPEDTASLDLASHIGFARIDSQASDHYAFRRGDIDWQIWIARGPRPLPLKVVITDRSDPAQPQFTSELSWNLNPRFAPATFAFRPPADTHKIVLVEATTN